MPLWRMFRLTDSFSMEGSSKMDRYVWLALYSSALLQDSGVQSISNLGDRPWSCISHRPHNILSKCPNKWRHLEISRQTTERNEKKNEIKCISESYFNFFFLTKKKKIFGVNNEKSSLHQLNSKCATYCIDGIYWNHPQNSR